MFCSKCGTQNADGAGFCSSCGSPLQQMQPPRQSANAAPDMGVQRKNEIPESPRTDTSDPGTQSLNITFEGIPVTVTGRFKWTGVDRMSPDQLAQILIDMKATALRRISLYDLGDKR